MKKKGLILLFVGVSLALLGCGKESSQEDNLDKIVNNTEAVATTTNEDGSEEPLYEYSDGMGTTDYGDWWNFTEKDGERVLVFDGESNKLGLLTLIPDKLPPDTKIQILNTNYIQMRTDIAEGRTVAELQATDGSLAYIYLDVTDSPELVFEGAKYVNIQTVRDRIGVVKFTNPSDGETHDVIVLTGTVVIEH